MQASKDQTSLCKYAAFAACIHKIRNAFKISCHNLSIQYQKIYTWNNAREYDTSKYHRIMTWLHYTYGATRVKSVTFGQSINFDSELVFFHILIIGKSKKYLSKQWNPDETESHLDFHCLQMCSMSEFTLCPKLPDFTLVDRKFNLNNKVLT